MENLMNINECVIWLEQIMIKELRKIEHSNGKNV